MTRTQRLRRPRQVPQAGNHCRRSGSVRTLGLAPRRKSTRASCRGSMPEPTIHEEDETEFETENDDTSGSESSPQLGPSKKGCEACCANCGASVPTTPAMPASHAQAAGGVAAELSSEEQALARIYQNIKEEARRRLLLQQLLAEEVVPTPTPHPIVGRDANSYTHPVSHPTPQLRAYKENPRTSPTWRRKC